MNALNKIESAQTPVLEATGISKTFTVGARLTREGVRQLKAVNDVHLSVSRGEVVGVVGESGCGKSTLGRCLLRLTDFDAGKLLFEGQDISRMGTAELRPLRPRMQMVFQDPSASLNPRRRIGDILAEPMRVHRNARGERYDAAAIRARQEELLDLVGLSPDHLSRFPHEFSGGQRQRIGIARALVLNPSLLVADEPVSALDVSIQAQVVNLLLDLQERLGIASVFISHDLSVIRQIAGRIVVMYLGSVVEEGPTETIFAHPAHPYTAALLSSVPVPRGRGRKRERVILAGDVPSPLNIQPGCSFRSRCPIAQPRCAAERPALQATGAATRVACHFPEA